MFEWGGVALVAFGGTNLATVFGRLVCFFGEPRFSKKQTPACSFPCPVMACFFDRNPLSANILARSHGRVEAAMVAVKTVLVLMAAVQEYMSPYIRVTVVISASIIMTYGYLNYLPFYTPFVNSMHVAFSAVFSWASLCLLLAIVRNQNQVTGRREFFFSGSGSRYLCYLLPTVCRVGSTLPSPAHSPNPAPLCTCCGLEVPTMSVTCLRCP